MVINFKNIILISSSAIHVALCNKRIGLGIRVTHKPHLPPFTSQTISQLSKYHLFILLLFFLVVIIHNSKSLGIYEYGILNTLFKIYESRCKVYMQTFFRCTIYELSSSSSSLFLVNVTSRIIVLHNQQIFIYDEYVFEEGSYTTKYWRRNYFKVLGP